MLLVLAGRAWPVESDSKCAIGTLQGSGTIWVDQQTSPLGATVFPGDVVATGNASTALVSFRSGALAAVGENSQVELLPRSGSVDVDLRSGLLVVRNAARLQARVRVAGVSVVLDSEGSTCVIASKGRSAEVFGNKGRVEIRGFGPPAVLGPGQYAQIEPGGPQAPGLVVGKVVASLPEGWVQHSGLAVEVPLVLGELVNQDDRVRTSKQGRVRIQLLDASSLALGPRTTIEISGHDPETQNTQIELRSGTLLADVTRPPRAGSSFLLRTPAANVKVTQGIVVVDARARWSDVCVLTGSATVRGSIGSPVGDVAPRPNECTRVAMNEPPADPAAGARLISSLRKQVEFQPNTETEVITPLPMAAALGPPPASVAVKASAATSLAAAVLSAVTFLLTGDAQSDLRRADQQLKNAATAAGRASADAQAAEAAATRASNTATQVLQSVNAFFGSIGSVVSPSSP